jgi:hypothetical protein
MPSKNGPDNDPAAVAALLNHDQRAMVVILLAIDAVGQDAPSVVDVGDANVVLANPDLANYLIETDAGCRAIYERTREELAAGRVPPWLDRVRSGD